MTGWRDLPLTRRHALGALGAPVALAASTRGVLGQVPAPAFTLLLVNDIYRMGEEKGRGGFARVAAIARAERARGVPVLFCHAGDCFSPSLMSGFDQGQHIVTIQNRIGLDVFVPGNHEFDFGKEAYAKRVAEQRYPTFCANLRAADGSVLPGHETAASSSWAGSGSAWSGWRWRRPRSSASPAICGSRPLSRRFGARRRRSAGKARSSSSP